jgi:hypothetical protein
VSRSHHHRSSIAAAAAVAAVAGATAVATVAGATAVAAVAGAAAVAAVAAAAAVAVAAAVAAVAAAVAAALPAALAALAAVAAAAAGAAAVAAVARAGARAAALAGVRRLHAARHRRQEDDTVHSDLHEPGWTQSTNMISRAPTGSRCGLRHGLSASTLCRPLHPGSAGADKQQPPRPSQAVVTSRATWTLELRRLGVPQSMVKTHKMGINVRLENLEKLTGSRVGL